jgi:hypothetical protein
MLPPDADESLKRLRQRATAPKVSAELEKAGVPFAFWVDGRLVDLDLATPAARRVGRGRGGQ